MISDAAARLTSNDPRVAISAATSATDKPDTDIYVEVLDRTYKLQGYANDYTYLSVMWPRNDVETGRLVLKGDDPMVPVLRACSSTVVPIVITNGSGTLQWSGRVSDTDYALDGQGNWTLTASLVGDTAYLTHILAWVNFTTPIEYQGPLREAVYVGNACSVVETIISENAFRLQAGYWDMANTLSSLDPDWRAWFSTLLESDGNLADMLHAPVYVIHHKPSEDTSPFVFLTARFDPILHVVQGVIKDNGLDLEVRLWRPGDPQPDPDRTTLHIPCYVVTVTDRSGITGPTGRALIDGIFKDLAELQQGAFGEAAGPFIGTQAQQYAAEGIYIAPELGVNFTPPWAMIIADHPKTPLLSANVIDHHCLAHTTIIGGKSPQWLDDLINATLTWLIDSIEIFIGFTGIPTDLLSGLFTDTILAFELALNEDRRLSNGPYCYPEQMFPSADGAPYNVQSLFDLLSAQWDTRGFSSAKISFLNGTSGLQINRDIFRSGMMIVALQNSGQAFMDYVERITLTDDRKSARARVEVQVGDGKLHDNPMAIFQRRLKEMWKFLTAVTLQDQ